MPTTQVEQIQPFSVRDILDCMTTLQLYNELCIVANKEIKFEGKTDFQVTLKSEHLVAPPTRFASLTSIHVVCIVP